MYATWPLHTYTNTVLAVIQKVGNTIGNLYLSLARGVQAAQYAELHPEDHKAILRILEGK